MGRFWLGRDVQAFLGVSDSILPSQLLRTVRLPFLVTHPLTSPEDYLLAKDKMASSFTDSVENKTRLSRKAQLEAYDGCARCRPIWDDFANKYDAIITPSAIDEAPLGLASTGNAVS